MPAIDATRPFSPVLSSRSNPSRNSRSAASTSPARSSIVARLAVESGAMIEVPLWRAAALVALGRVLALSGLPREAAASLESGIDIHARKHDVVSAARVRALLASVRSG
jgi:hypothetical protein